ncbi:MAG: Fic family protein [Candidatus Tagabacteria bacterium]
MKTKSLASKKKEISELASAYSKALDILKKYDQGELKVLARKKPVFVLKYEEAKKVVEELKKEILTAKEADGLFGQEYRGKFESVVKNLYQTFGARELYKTLEEKASHLLYLTVKDHPFVDGNKRIAAFLFVYFLHKNKYLYKKNRERKISDNALVSLTLLTAISNPKEKEAMIAVITNLLD